MSTKEAPKITPNPDAVAPLIPKAVVERMELLYHLISTLPIFQEASPKIRRLCPMQGRRDPARKKEDRRMFLKMLP